MTTGVKSARLYCLKIAHSLAINFLRHQTVVPIKLVGDCATLDIADDGPAIDEELNDTQERDLLFAAIETLPPKQRAVIRMRKIHGMSQQQIAAHMGITENTVEDHLKRGVVALAEALKM